MVDKKELKEKIDKLPENTLEEISDYIDFIMFKKHNKIQDITKASEKSLAKDWLTKEEDEAWKNL
ncbi:hypothetical protein C8C76_1572 [Halanaerobium saccharolyticum]|jgi:hypothetical protein|uniref:DUF2281 domain-containing protein n=2 Tax=Bacteria TaxID=2 RepID=A0A1G6NW99_9BACT|nr:MULTISPECIES: DUF2281 domain-containing protein [Bacteria]PTV93007.1 hypothetical protein C8C76_1572 [Halanaerobium saccharolyticum]TGG86757.1 DUF2281 domain-containing protein [Geotoga petraea]SDC72213.1 hypothetical protein SAMN04488588_1689 [Geotoga petraea]